MNAKKTTVVSASLRSKGHQRGEMLILAAMLGDFLCVGASLVANYFIRFEWDWMQALLPSPDMDFKDYVNQIIFGAVVMAALLFHTRIYERNKLLGFREVQECLSQAAVTWTVLFLALSLIFKVQPSISRLYVVASGATLFLTLFVWRFALHRFIQTMGLFESLRQRILVVGWNSDAARLFQAIHQDSSHRYLIIGSVPSAQGSYTAEPPVHLQKLGDYGSIGEIIDALGCEMVLVADLDSRTGEMVALANLCEQKMVQFKIIPSYFQILVSGLHLETISGVPILGLERLPLDQFSSRLAKRGMDVAGALVGLVFSLPLMVIFGVAIYGESPGPVIYRQRRVGMRGRVFWIYKLRSMQLDAESDGNPRWALENDPRRLKVGAFMRRWNIDEIPQFWNVLKGEMSLVGPRPERPELITGFNEEVPHYAARHSIHPGMTGWAQVNGLRGNTDLTERIRFDLYYLENWSLWLDIYILLATFYRIRNAY